MGSARFPALPTKLLPCEEAPSPGHRRAVRQCSAPVALVGYRGCRHPTATHWAARGGLTTDACKALSRAPSPIIVRDRPHEAGVACCTTIGLRPATSAEKASSAPAPGSHFQPKGTQTPPRACEGSPPSPVAPDPAHDRLRSSPYEPCSTAHLAVGPRVPGKMDRPRLGRVCGGDAHPEKWIAGGNRGRARTQTIAIRLECFAVCFLTTVPRCPTSAWSRALPEARRRARTQLSVRAVACSSEPLAGACRHRG
jgi:hypothetical protein